MLPNTSQIPSTAAQPLVNASNGQRMQGAGEQELSFNKLASTQVAWLAALLVAVGLLLTQLRLGRLSVRSPRPKGNHRRPRALFRK